MNIAIIGTYPPKKCGIATFTFDLCQHLASLIKPQCKVEVVAVNDNFQDYAYTERVKCKISTYDLQSYQRAADYINHGGFDGVILQHEFGIYGGPFGSFILHFVKSLEVMLVTTLHSILNNPCSEQREILQTIARHSYQIITTSRTGLHLLRNKYSIHKNRCVFIPHGVHDLPSAQSKLLKASWGLQGRRILLSFGLIGSGKGIEYVLDALPAIIEQNPNIIYIILGATHPHIKKNSGESYRRSLKQKVDAHGLENHVVFIDNYLATTELLKLLKASDICVAPYLCQEQITSGTLAYAMAAGKPVIATPYWYAQEMLANERGIIVPFRDAKALAREINRLLTNEDDCKLIGENAFQATRWMLWTNVSKKYLKLFLRANKTCVLAKKRQNEYWQISKKLRRLPKVSLLHLRALTDKTGIVQHAMYSKPDLTHGYCLDDNARALIATLMYYRIFWDQSVLPFIRTYLDFIKYAFDRDKGRFRNLLNYERRWLHSHESDDAHGRALWALGYLIKNAPNSELFENANRYFRDGLKITKILRQARPWAYTILGLEGYLKVNPDDQKAIDQLYLIAMKLNMLYCDHASKHWQWFEDKVTYANAKLPHALYLAGRLLNHKDMIQHGLEALNWLIERQYSNDMKHFSFIGNKGWMVRNRNKEKFDQQPIEAMALVQACLEVFRWEHKKYWLHKAHASLEWFLGRNDLGRVMINEMTGACFDGLCTKGPNRNQGAESTLSWLISILSVYDVLSCDAVVEHSDNIQSKKSALHLN